MQRLLLVVVFILVAGCTSDPEPPHRTVDVSEPLTLDFQVVLESGAQPNVTAQGVTLTQLELVEGERVTWRVETEKPHVIGLVTAQDFFAVERTLQVVPEVDDGHLVELPEVTFQRLARTQQAMNATKESTTIRMALAFDVDGDATLLLQRDVAPPRFTIGPIQDLTPYSFRVETTTEEPALATLLVERATGGGAIPFPTGEPATTQTFPVQGLDADTDYEFRIRFQDWSLNVAVSDFVTVHTPERALAPGPLVLYRFPAPNATLDASPDAIEANFSAAAGTLDPESHVRLFVDKNEVTWFTARTIDGVRYAIPEPMQTGPHSVSLELLNSEGGKTVSDWTFMIAGGGAAPPGPFWFALAALLWVAHRGVHRAR